jgi:hypothetical protein
MLMWIFLWIPLAIFLNGAILLAVIRQIKKDISSNIGPHEVPIEFIVLGESFDSYKTFLALTYKLDDVRESMDKGEIDVNSYADIIKELDEKILNLQEMLIYINTEAIPNPDILTKRYIQELILQVLVIRIIFEKLHGRYFKGDDTDVRVLKLSPIKKRGKNE